MREFHSVSRADTFVAQATPNIQYSDSKFIQICNDSGDVRLGLFHFSLPVHFRHYICTEAILVLYKQGGTGWPGRTATAKRVTEPWSENAKYSNRPSVASLHAADSDTTDDNPIEIDVTDIMTDVVAGMPFYGFQVSVNGSSGVHKVHSSEGPPGLRPRLRITYTARPDAVTHLTPNGVALYDPTPVVKWTTVYKPHHDRQTYSQVQFAPADLGGNPDWDVADFDSGWQENDVHHWDTGDPPAGPVYAGIPDGEQRFWRVRIKDEHGNISDWSLAAEVSYESGGTVEITSPDADDDNVQDTTPQIGWDFTPGAGGEGQHAFRVIYAVERSTGWVMLHDTDWIFSSDTDYTTPRGVIRHTDIVPPLRGRRYRVKVFVRDAGIDEFGYSRAWSDAMVPRDTRTFIFRNGVLAEGTLEAPGGGAPSGTGTKLVVTGIPSGSDLTYAMDTTPNPNVDLVAREVADDVIYFKPGKNLLSANQSSIESSNPATSPSNCSTTRSNDYAYDGDYSVKATVTADGDATFYVAAGAAGAPVVVGLTYIASVWSKHDPTDDEIRLNKISCGIVFYDSSNAVIGSVHYGDEAADSYPNKFTRAVSDAVEAPSGAVRAGIRVRMNDPNAGKIYYFDGFQIEENDVQTGWIIGDSVNVGDAASVVYSGIERPTALAVRQANPVVPIAHFSWARSSTPDEWLVEADDEIIAHIEGPDADAGDGSYGWTWHGMHPGVKHSVVIRAKTIGIGLSAPSNEVTVKYVPRGIHLTVADRGLWVPIYGQDEIRETLSRDGNTYYLVNRRDPVRINGTARGMYGSVSGTIMGDGTGTADDHMQDLYTIFGLWSASPHVRLTFGHQAYHVIVADLTESQNPSNANGMYNISFNWWQTGDFAVPISVNP